MRRLRDHQKIKLAFVFLFVTFRCWSQPSFEIVDLKTDYLISPLGIDTQRPRFSWRQKDDRAGARQTAYRVMVNTDSLALTRGQGTVWSTDWNTSDRNLVTYGGQALMPFTRYYWRVDVRDQTSATAFAIASFETGMMDGRNWKGSWISDGYDMRRKEAPYFRKKFSLVKKVVSARAYIAVAGLYELSINGVRVGDHCLDPMYTRFDRRTLYVTYDVTKLLRGGDNAIGVLLGNGWYNHQSTAVWFFDKASWRGRPTFCLDLRVTYDNGSIETITSGKDWKTMLSPVIFNSIYTAEHYDARKEINGWNVASFDDKGWKDVIYRSAPSGNIVAQALHPIRKVETIHAQSIRKLNDTTYVFDIGRNISGISSIRLSAPAGTILRLKHGERLYSNGRVDLSNIDVHYRPTDNTDPFQTDIFILKGEGEEVFAPRFNYKGFQYVEVTSSRPVTLVKESLVAYFMHSDLPVTGLTRSSNETLNKITFATNNSYLSNMFGYPTDCPQREKNGWTGDAVIANETGLYGFDGITVYEKWLADHRDEQQPNGVLPSIIPTSGWGYEWGNGPDWTSTIAVIPWNIYLFYGDSKLLADSYESMKRYVDHITEISPDGITTWGLGDWVPVKSKSPVPLTSTCYYYADVTIVARAARLFDKNEDYQKYSALAERIKNAFNARYLNRATGIYGSGLQTELSVPLFWGIVPDDLKATVAANLARRVEADQFHLDVGLLGQKAILNALSENGYGQVAYKLASQETYPSWGWWVKNGATTLYENWDIQAANDISLNHIMFGEIGAWLYKGLGGIYPDPEKPGFKHVIFKPTIADGMDHLEARHTGPYGEIVSSWKRDGKALSYTVVIPPNSSGTVYLPQIKDRKVILDGKVITGSMFSAEAGIYRFTWK